MFLYLSLDGKLRADMVILDSLRLSYYFLTAVFEWWFDTLDIFSPVIDIFLFKVDYSFWLSLIDFLEFYLESFGFPLAFNFFFETVLSFTVDMLWAAKLYFNTFASSCFFWFLFILFFISFLNSFNFWSSSFRLSSDEVIENLFSLPMDWPVLFAIRSRLGLVSNDPESSLWLYGLILMLSCCVSSWTRILSSVDDRKCLASYSLSSWNC
jgi:hypothetical protein